MKATAGLFTLILCLFIVFSIMEAKDGQGGRGRHGGGAARGHGGGARSPGGSARPNLSRSPSMSRAQQWSRASQAQLRSAQPSSALLSTSRNQSVRPQSRVQLQQFLNSHKMSDSAMRSQIQQGMASQRPVYRESRAMSRLRSQMNRYPNRGTWFNNQFWDRYNYRPGYWNARQNFWRHASWNSVNTWLGWGVAAPLYYDSGYYIAVNPDVYYGSAQAPVSQPPPLQPSDISNESWIPLGVFAIVQDTAAEPSMFFQLALNKDGSIGGAYYNQTADGVYPIDGMVDRASQRTIWKMSVGSNSPVFQTALYNLTLPETTVEVYFGDNEAQEWRLIRMNQ